MKKIPLVNLSRLHKKIEKDVLKEFRNTFRKGDFILGGPVKDFEKEFSASVGSKYASGCSSGTSALELSMRALGIGKGDEVITSDLTFFATVEAIHAVGAIPVLADICPETYSSNLENIKSMVTKKTKAIISVHLYGNIAYLDEISKYCKQNKIFFIQDAAQGHMGTFKGKPIEVFSNAVCYSFYPGKNLGALGDAGCVTSMNKNFINKVNFYRDHGRKSKYLHESMALSARMDSVQALALRIKLKNLKKMTERRKIVASIYDQALKPYGFSTIKVQKKGSCVYHLYTVLVKNRNKLLKSLNSKGIGAGIHYPVPMHKQPGFFKIYKTKKNNNYLSTAVANHTISLPICSEINDSEVNFVIKNFIKEAQPFSIS